MLTADKIIKNYGKHRVLNNVSLKAEKGECIGIIGANGCGKSTLLNILAGVLKADGGTITLGGNEPCTPANVSRMIGYVPQENPLFEKLSALDNLRFWYGKDSTGLKADLENGLPALFKITDYLNKRVENMSGGMKKRLSIACSLAKHQPILILDEPCAALDIPGKEDIHNYIKSYLKEGNTVIITSHEEAEIMLCDAVYFLENGTLTRIERDELDISKLVERMRTE